MFNSRVGLRGRGVLVAVVAGVAAVTVTVTGVTSGSPVAASVGSVEIVIAVVVVGVPVASGTARLESTVVVIVIVSPLIVVEGWVGSGVDRYTMVVVV